MSLKKIEDRPTPAAVYNWRLYFYSFIAAFGAMLYGYDSAFIGGTLALPSFQAEFGINSGNSAGISANIVSGYQAGALIGALITYPFCERFGRKPTILLAGAVFTLGAGLHLVADAQRGLAALYVGRVVGGLGVGAVSLVVPIYISEISAPAIRGRLVGLYEMLLQIGGLLGFWINYAVAQTMPAGKPQWTVPIAIQLIPGGILIALGWFLVESPRWLRSKGKYELADKNMALIRNLPIEHEYCQQENAMIDAQLAIEIERTGGSRSLMNQLKELALPGIRNRVGICFMLFLIQNATGINAINYYSPTVFRSLGIVGTNTGLLTTGVFGVVKNVATLIWLLFLIDNLGRRRLLLIGAGAAGCFMLYIGIYVAVGKPQNNTSGVQTPGGWSAVAFIYLWTAAYGPTWNGTPWVYVSEVFPTHIRTLSMALLSASQWLWQFAIARATPYMFLSMGFGVYIFFAALTLVGGVFVFFFVPETKGQSLEHMDEIFGFSRSSPLVSDIEAGKRQTAHMEKSGSDDAGSNEEVRL